MNNKKSFCISKNTVIWPKSQKIVGFLKVTRVILAFVIAVLVASSSCKKKSSGLDNTNPTIPATISTIPPKDGGQTLLNELPSYKYLTSKMGLSIEMEEQTIGTNAVMRIESGKNIWISVQKLGFEVARVLFRPDSLFMVDNFHQQYIATTYQNLSSFTGVMIDLPLVEAMMLGRPIPSTGWMATNTPTTWQNLLGPYALLATTDSLKSPCLSAFKASGSSQGQPIVFAATFGQTKNVIAGFYVPYTKRFSIQTPAKGSATTKQQVFSIEHKQIALPDAAPDFTFRIPASYSLISLEK